MENSVDVVNKEVNGGKDIRGKNFTQVFPTIQARL